MISLYSVTLTTGKNVSAISERETGIFPKLKYVDNKDIRYLTKVGTIKIKSPDQWVIHAVAGKVFGVRLSRDAR